MSQALPTEIPAPLRRLLDDGVSGVGTEIALQLLTVGGDGWPHASMLSVGEIIAVDAQSLRLALWPRSNAAINCAANGRATLIAVVDAAGYGLELRLTPTRAINSLEHGTLSTFAACVVAVRVDIADYASLESGIRFRLHDPAPVLARWDRTRELLRAQDGVA